MLMDGSPLARYLQSLGGEGGGEGGGGGGGVGGSGLGDVEDTGAGATARVADFANLRTEKVDARAVVGAVHADHTGAARGGSATADPDVDRGGAGGAIREPEVWLELF